MEETNKYSITLTNEECFVVHSENIFFALAELSKKIKIVLSSQAVKSIKITNSHIDTDITSMLV